MSDEWKAIKELTGSVNFVSPEATLEKLKLAAADIPTFENILTAMINAYEDMTNDRLPDGDGFDREVVAEMLSEAIRVAEDIKVVRQQPV